MIRNPSDFEKSEPLYIALAGQIREKILKGKLTPGERMPTVKEMCSESGLSAGTVRQAYGLLQTEGLIELTPGRGTFVSVPKANEKSRKAQALEAIDGLLNDLASMGFSQAESRMLLTLRLAQKDLDAHLTPVALVAESEEELRHIYDSLSEISGIEVTSFSAEDIRSAGSVILSEFPLVIAPLKLSSEIGGLLGERSNALCPIAYTPSAGTLLRLSRIHENAHILIYTQTESFGKLIRKFVRTLFSSSDTSIVTYGKLNLNQFANSFDAIITSPDYAAFSDEADLPSLRAFTESGKPVIPFELTIDEGSLIFVSRQLDSISRRYNC